MPRRAVPVQRFRAPRHRSTPQRSVGARNPSHRAATVYSGTITNSGTVATAPSISIAGPLTTPTVYFENATAGKTVWVNVTVGSGQTLVVDFAARTVTLAGVLLSGVLSVDSRWWDLAPGANTVRSNVTATITHRDAYS